MIIEQQSDDRCEQKKTKSEYNKSSKPEKHNNININNKNK